MDELEDVVLEGGGAFLIFRLVQYLSPAKGLLVSDLKLILVSSIQCHSWNWIMVKYMTVLNWLRPCEIKAADRRLPWRTLGLSTDLGGTCLGLSRVWGKSFANTFLFQLVSVLIFEKCGRSFICQLIHNVLHGQIANFLNTLLARVASNIALHDLPALQHVLQCARLGILRLAAGWVRV